MNISSFAVKNWQFTLTIFLTAFIMGLIALFTMPRGEDPEYQPRIFPIVVIYPGTSTVDMEHLVVDPIEKRIGELEDIKQIKSNIDVGIAIIKVQYNFECDYNEKRQELIRELDILKKDLPKDIADISIKKVAPSDVNIIQMALISDSLPFSTLKFHADKLKDKFEKIKQLKTIDVWGCPEQIVRISLDYQKISLLNIPVNQVIQILQTQNINIPAGSIDTGINQFSVNVGGTYSSIDEILDTILFSANQGVIRLRDIASVKMADDKEKHICRLNGKRSVFVTAALKSNENISAVSKLYNPIIEEFSKELPTKIKFIKNFDQSYNVSKRLNSLGRDFIFAILLVSVTLLPLGFRSSLVVMLSIPLSLSIGLTLLSAFGYTINQLSIVGLVMTLGLLVDDSIIVVENTERWLRNGYSRTDAAIGATKQITWAIIGCTAILITSFIPLAFMPGESGAFIKSLPVTVIFTVFASLIVSLTIVPFLSSFILKEKNVSTKNTVLDYVTKIIHLTYTNILEKALKSPIKTLSVAFILFLISIAGAYFLGFTLFPKSEKPQFSINIETGKGSNIKETDNVVHYVEQVISKISEIKFYSSNVGRGNPRVYYNEMQLYEASNYGQIFVQLQPDIKPKKKTEIINQLQSKFSTYPNAKIIVKDFEQGPPLESPIAIRLFGDNLDTLRTLSSDIEKLLKSTEGTMHVNNPLRVTKTDFKVDINKEKAGMLGIPIIDIQKSVRLALTGLDIGYFMDDYGKDYKIKMGIPETKASLDVLKNTFINTSSGLTVPLSTIADIHFSVSYPQINHLDNNRYTTVTSHIQEGYLANDINSALEKILSDKAMPKGYYYSLAGEVENASESFDGFIYIVLLSGLIFLSILILEFKNFKSLLIVLSVIPLGMIGAVLMLFIAGQPLSFVSIIGFIALIGIEIKNSILLVDFTNQLRKEGMELEQAILLAGEVRFIPILLTAVTAIVGLIPLVIEFSPLYSPLALVIIGGLLTSTFLSRIITPVMYKILPPVINK